MTEQEKTLNTLASISVYPSSQELFRPSQMAEYIEEGTIAGWNKLQNESSKKNRFSEVV